MDLRFSALLAHTANLQRDPKKRPTPYSWEDFKFEFDRPVKADRERSVEDLIKVAEYWNMALGGIDKRVKKTN